MLVAHVPPAVVLLTFLPLVPTIVTVAVEAVALHEFGAAYGRKIRWRDDLRLILGTLPYQVLLGLSALRAVVREAAGESSWEKTAHAGLHRQPVLAAEQA
jgi:hypothetical protein